MPLLPHDCIVWQRGVWWEEKFATVKEKNKN
jgi:hypothetical protein